jgi:hypothetical protein
MKDYRKSFPNENICIHNYTDCNPITGESSPQKYRYKYSYIWRAFTLKNNVSRYFHAELSNKWRETNFYPLPKLRKGYYWKGPYLNGIYPTWED